MPGVLPRRAGTLRGRLRDGGYDDLDRLDLDLDRPRLEPRPRDVNPQLFDEPPVESKQHAGTAPKVSTTKRSQ